MGVALRARAKRQSSQVGFKLRPSQRTLRHAASTVFRIFNHLSNHALLRNVDAPRDRLSRPSGRSSGHLLSFFPAPRSACWALNGSGKSTVLRIVAGADKEYEGEVAAPAEHQDRLPAAGTRLDPDKTVRQERGIRNGRGMEPRPSWRPVYAAYAEPGRRLRQAGGAGAAGGDHRHRWLRHRHQMEIAADALLPPDWDATSACCPAARKRRVALCCRLLLSRPDMLLLDEPTNHLDAESVGGCNGSSCALPRHRGRRHHDRYFLDNRRWILELDRGHGIPWKGNYSLAGTERKPAWDREQAGRAHMKAMKQELEWVRQNPKGPPGQEQGASRPLRRNVQLRIPEAQRKTHSKCSSRSARRLGERSSNSTACLKGFGDRLLMDDNLSFKASRRRHRRHHPERRR